METVPAEVVVETKEECADEPEEIEEVAPLAHSNGSICAYAAWLCIAAAIIASLVTAN